MNEKKFTTIIHGTTDVFVNLGIPTHAVEALIHEVPKSHWGSWQRNLPQKNKNKDKNIQINLDTKNNIPSPI